MKYNLFGLPDASWYFQDDGCDAYSPHERGSNENRNRVLRRFIPKGQPIEEISDDELIQINWYLNSRPLKCLNWRTPIEIFLLNLRH